MLAFTKCATPKGRPAPAQPEILEGESVPSPCNPLQMDVIRGPAGRKNGKALQDFGLGGRRAPFGRVGHFVKAKVLAIGWPLLASGQASPHDSELKKTCRNNCASKLAIRTQLLKLCAEIVCLHRKPMRSVSHSAHGQNQ